ncbi:MAG TPA: DUF3419 family protein [Acidimicrobiales bacterium]|nr:DUF3419 family protein [Acidimicrobiales bacterium]
MAQSFADTLNYTACNEDWESEQRALQIGPTDTVFCVTASGDRPLHLLLGGPARVVSLDMNRLQTQLCQLKSAAIQQLDYESYASFLGLHPGADRLRTLERLERDSPFLRGRPFEISDQVIDDGVLYSGRWERYYRTLAGIAGVLRKRKLAQLFAFDDLEEQRRFVDREWDTRFWRQLMMLTSNTILSRHLFGDPGLFTNIDASVKSVGGYLHERMRRTLHQCLARENFMLTLLFRSQFNERCLPPYLDPRFHPILRERVERVDTVTGEINAYLGTVDDNSFSRFSTSDLASHLSPGDFERLMKNIVRTAQPGARFCIRQMLSNYAVPDSVRPFVEREPELEAEIERRDRSFVYRFMVGTIHK